MRKFCCRGQREYLKCHTSDESEAQASTRKDVRRKANGPRASTSKRVSRRAPVEIKHSPAGCMLGLLAHKARSDCLVIPRAWGHLGGARGERKRRRGVEKKGAGEEQKESRGRRSFWLGEDGCESTLKRLHFLNVRACWLIALASPVEEGDIMWRIEDVERGTMSGRRKSKRNGFRCPPPTA